jgi:hypothetical protein
MVVFRDPIKRTPFLTVIIAVSQFGGNTSPALSGTPGSGVV